MRAWVAVGLLFWAACDTVPVPDYVAPMDGVHDVFVVAHEDDDLLFMNPELSARLRAGHTIDVVYLTAGDAGSDEDVWTGRETGLAAAYQYMSGAGQGTWTSERVAGKHVRRFRLDGWPVTLTFLRLPDGNLDGSGFGHGSLLELWTGELASLPVLGAENAGELFDHDDILALLAAVLEGAHADSLHTLDATGLYADSLSHGDHSDHVISARLALEASLAYAAPHRLSMYRTYNLSDEPPNLSDAQAADKRAAYDRYNSNGPVPSQYAEWMQRIAAIRTLDPFEGATLEGEHGCLEASSVRPCSGGAAQAWSYSARGELRSGSACLDATDGPHLAACDGSSAQAWRVLDNGQIHGARAACLDARRGVGSDVPVTLAACGKVAAQEWHIETHSK